MALLNKGTERLLSRDKRFAKLYAQMLVKGEINWELLGKVYRPDDKNPEWKAKRTVRRQVIQELTNQELNNIYLNKGIDANKVIDEELLLLDSAKANDDRRIWLDVVRNWRDSLSLKGQTASVIQSIELKGDLSHLLPSSKDVKQLSDSDIKLVKGSLRTPESNKE